MFVASFAIDQGRQSPYAEINALRIVQCVNACSGLDMSDVPEGAVKELVDTLRLVQALHGDSFGKTLLTCNAKYPTLKEYIGAALAPFVKE